jgi:hypothetical protein
MGFPTKNGIQADEASVTNKQLHIRPEIDVDNNPSRVGAVKMVSEVDSGVYTGLYDLRSTETDDDYRQRVAIDTLLDYDYLRTTVQNTGKHTFTFTTLAATITASGLTTNSSAITTTTTGLTFGTHAMFPIHPTQTTVCETSLGFTAQPTANTVVDWGLFQRGATTAFAPLDGVYFRLTSAGLFGVINTNGTETLTSVFTLANGSTPWTYVNNTNYRFLIQVTNVRTTFWVSTNASASMDLLGEIATPSGNPMPFLSQSLPWSLRHAIVGGASGDANFKAIFTDYKISTRGTVYADSLANIQSRVLGTYQALSGATPGALIAGTVTSGTLVKPTAAIPANTSLVANLPNSLGGRIYEQLTGGLAANTDAIFASFTVPAGSSTVQGKRLKVTGIKLSGMCSTVVVGGPAYTEWYIAFGHTADSLATTETGSMATATTKAPRRVMLPELTTNMPATAAAGTLLVQPQYFAKFDNAIYVNPGERIALVGNKTITTAITSGVLSFTYQFDYSWE